MSRPDPPIVANNVWIAPIPNIDLADWQELGHADTDGLTAAGGFVEFPTVAGQPVPTTGGGILDQIDDALAERCACGCGTVLAPDGPSAYFASQECQRNWNSARAADPAAVYSRTDAAAVYVGHDDQAVPLREPPRPRRHPPAGGDREELVRYWTAGPGAESLLPECDDEYGAGYRRYCHHCRQLVIPRVAHDEPVEVSRWGCLDPVLVICGALRHFCPRCLNPLANPVYAAQVVRQPRGLLLELRDAHCRVQHVVRIRDIENTRDRDDFFRRVWSTLEHRLLYFRRSWFGDPP